MDKLLSKREADDAGDWVDDPELGDYLEKIAPYIGYVIIFFKSLEDLLAMFIRECILRDPIQDERLDVFLADMLFAGKCTALMHLYGQVISTTPAGKVTMDDLNALERTLVDCAKRRNEYAHAHWSDLRKDAYVRVKAQSKKLGLFFKYKKFDLAQMEADVEFIRASTLELEAFHEQAMDQMYGRQ